jgi:hypothetical protein
VLEHVERPARALDEIRRIASSRAIVVASVPTESPVLQLVRYIALAGGRSGHVHPHWGGEIGSLPAFETAWIARLEPIEAFKAPFKFAPRWANYDVVYVGRPRKDGVRSARPRQMLGPDQPTDDVRRSLRGFWGQAADKPKYRPAVAPRVARIKTFGRVREAELRAGRKSRFLELGPKNACRGARVRRRLEHDQLSMLQAR